LENWEATCCEASFAHFARISVEVAVAVASCLKGHFWREWAQDGADWSFAVAMPAVQMSSLADGTA
jgi:hypothetical protein